MTVDELKQFQINYTHYINEGGEMQIDEVFLDFVKHPTGKVLVYKRQKNKFFGPASWSIEDIRGLNIRYEYKRIQ